MCQECLSRTALSRRALLRGATSVAISASALSWAGQAAATADPSPAPSPDQVMKDLAAGNARHVRGVQTCTDFLANRAALAKGQHPVAIVLACADSRVAPEYVFDQAPGRLFIVRVAGNFVDEEGLASMEYAIEHLGVPVIVVLGHSSCGALTAAVAVEQQHETLPGHLPALVEHLSVPVRTALTAAPTDPVAAAIRQNVVYSMERLAKERSLVSSAVSEGKVRIAGGVYDLATGEVALMGS